MSMRCPECEELGIPSRTREGPKRIRVPSHAVTFFDEFGGFHNHDLASILTPLSCSEGHHWEHHSATKCPTCLVVVDPAGTDSFGRPIA